jgi:hypothetical protein
MVPKPTVHKYDSACNTGLNSTLNFIPNIKIVEEDS